MGGQRLAATSAPTRLRTLETVGRSFSKLKHMRLIALGSADKE
jgi:hypothetical protein